VLGGADGCEVVGAALGVAVGEFDGAPEGDLVGFELGSDEGCRVGKPVGVVLGATDGAPLGVPVGCDVREPLGVEVVSGCDVIRNVAVVLCVVAPRSAPRPIAARISTSNSPDNASSEALAR
jgi:hypothetical protein